MAVRIVSESLDRPALGLPLAASSSNEGTNLNQFPINNYELHP
jgi:hypothetical protein